MAEQDKVLVVVRLDGIAPGIPHSRCYALLQEVIEGATYTSGDLTFTATVEGIGQHAEVRDC